MSARQRVEDALRAHGRNGRGNSWQCPSHEDGSPSLSVNNSDNEPGVVLYCHAGCPTEEVLETLGLAKADLYDEPLQKGRGSSRPQRRKVAEYPYCDEHGEVLYVIERWEPGKNGRKKDFLRRAPDGSYSTKGIRQVPYRLPEVLAAAQAGGIITVAEGEKDVDSVRAQGGVATCNAGGAGKWRDEYTAYLAGASEVYVVADRDEPGRKHALQVAASVHRAGIPVRILEPAKGKDVTDHLEAGLTFEDLRPVVQASEPEPPSEDEPPLDDVQPDIEVRRLILTPASRIKIKPVRWLWDTTPAGAPPTSHGRIPMYSMAIAAGGPGLGKSQFAVWFTARITRGELPGELHGKPRGVIYAATEDSWTYTIAPRLIAAGADLDLVFRVDVQDDERLHARLTLPIDISLIGNAAEEYSVALLVADPLLSFVDKSINDYRAAEVREALEPLIAAADRHHFTILGLAHFTKNGAADPLSRVAGSGAFGQLIRSLLAFAQQETDDGETEFVMSLEKNNLGRLGLPSFAYEIQPFTVPTDEGPSYVSRFVLGPESTTSVKEVMRAEGQPDDREAMNDAMAWLSAYLHDVGGSDMAREIKKNARKAMISDSAIDRAKLKLRLKSKQQGFGKEKAAHWYLPEAWPGDDANG